MLAILGFVDGSVDVLAVFVSDLSMVAVGDDIRAVDVEARFCNLIQRRAARNGVDIEVVNSDFMWAEQVQEPYDAVIFFECFHHCADHLHLLAAGLGTLTGLVTRSPGVVAPGARLVDRLSGTATAGLHSVAWPQRRCPCAGRGPPSAPASSAPR